MGSSNFDNLLLNEIRFFHKFNIKCDDVTFNGIHFKKRKNYESPQLIYNKNDMNILKILLKSYRNNMNIELTI